MHSITVTTSRTLTVGDIIEVITGDGILIGTIKEIRSSNCFLIYVHEYAVSQLFVLSELKL